ncbi:general secretion pathway protein G [Methylobacterium nodulans ORS 2060]|uniref:Type II secretion system core protein G n=2 Tax=Methylobacterium nodulans TaxID=114616 RepID=B8IR82_METNO|nr:general secretion pathway protein G [Methylobacterium nodulans ORS 2060]
MMILGFRRMIVDRSRSAPAPARDARGGFTLVELLVVLVILGLVMGLAGPRVLGYLSSSRERTAKLQIESFASALDLFFLDNGRYPSTSEGLQALVQRPAAADSWGGPYLKQGTVPADPWGHPYEYRAPGKSGPYAIISLGPDGQRGSGGAIGRE